jgi:hypothetical protein
MRLRTMTPTPSTSEHRLLSRLLFGLLSGVVGLALLASLIGGFIYRGPLSASVLLPTSATGVLRHQPSQAPLKGCIHDVLPVKGLWMCVDHRDENPGGPAY